MSNSLALGFLIPEFFCGFTLEIHDPPFTLEMQDHLYTLEMHDLTMKIYDHQLSLELAKRASEKYSQMQHPPPIKK